MRPHSWELFYCNVAEITNHTTTFVEEMMSYASALFFQTIWFSRKGVEWEAGSKTAPTKKVIQ